MGCLSFPFLLCHYFWGDWLVQGNNVSKKGYDRVFWSSMCLKTQLTSFFIQIKIWFD